MAKYITYVKTEDRARFDRLFGKLAERIEYVDEFPEAVDDRIPQRMKDAYAEWEIHEEPEWTEKRRGATVGNAAYDRWRKRQSSMSCFTLYVSNVNKLDLNTYRLRGNMYAGVPVWFGESEDEYLEKVRVEQEALWRNILEISAGIIERTYGMIVRFRLALGKRHGKAHAGKIEGLSGVKFVESRRGEFPIGRRWVDSPYESSMPYAFAIADAVAKYAIGKDGVRI